MIRVLIADDHAMVREGIKRLLADAADIVIAGEAADGPGLLRLVAEDSWDVVLMDLAMPGTSGLEMLEQVCRLRSNLPVLVLSMYPEAQYAVRTLMAGAAGYINKGSSPNELISAIRTVAAGRRYVTAETAERLAVHVDKGFTKPPHENLSNREYQVLCLIAAGKTVGKIAEELALSIKTVSTFRSRILEKLHLSNNAQLIRYALEHGLAE